MIKKIHHLPLIIFIIIAAIILTVMNNDFLYTIQDCSIFCNGHTFMKSLTNAPGGTINWIGCYLTQFFYYPWLGTSFLILLWIFIYILCIKTYKLKYYDCPYALIPITALMCSIIGVGYWIYYMNMPGYWFACTLGCLYLSLSLYGYSKINESRLNILTILYLITTTIIGYYLCGWWGLLNAICCILLDIRAKSKIKRIILSCTTCVVLLISVPIIAYYLSTHMPIEKAWTIGFPLFQQNDYTNWKLSTPFFIIMVWFIIVSFYKTNTTLSSNEKNTRLFLSCFVATLFLITPFRFNYNDSRFKSEIRMYRLLEECKWEEIISEYQANSKSPTNQMIMCKNLALLHLNRLGEEGFNTGMVGDSPTKQGDLKVGMAQTIAPLLYYHHGCINYANNWALNNIAKYGLSVRNLKILIRCAVMNNEPELALKYTAILRTTTFHKQWASEWLEYSFNAHSAKECQEINTITPLIVLDDMIDDDQGMCEAFLLEYFATLIASTREQQEMALIYAMTLKDDELIKFQIENYYAMFGDTNIPKHVLEAVDIYNTNHSTDYLKFVQDYQKAIGTGNKIVEIGKQLKPIYGETYWWYYYFVNKFNTY